MERLRSELTGLRNNNIEEDDDSEKEEEYFKAPKTLSIKAAKAVRAEEEAVSAIKAVEFRFVSSANDVESTGFHPGFAHQVFGEEELIKGYRDLSIINYYSASSLLLFPRVTYSHKQLRCTPPILMDALKVWLPSEDGGASSVLASSLDHLIEDASRPWSPPGQMITEYQLNNNCKFQVWHGKFTDEAVRRYHLRMRPFCIWFIDGANYIDDTDPKWDLFMLFRVSSHNQYTFAGYVTCYPFFAWAGGKTPNDDAHMVREASRGPQRISQAVENVVLSIVTHGYDQASQETPPWYERRFRVSQFLIMPPFQRQGHGTRMLDSIYQWAVVNYAPLRDITVEDPSPSFVALRDYCDLLYCRTRGVLHMHNVQQPNDLDAIIACLKERHTCAHQIARVVQIVKWMQAKRSGQQSLVDQVRLEVKKRLFKENSADIPDDADTRKEIVAKLWEEEQKCFDATIQRLEKEPL